MNKNTSWPETEDVCYLPWVHRLRTLQREQIKWASPLCVYHIFTRFLSSESNRYCIDVLCIIRCCVMSWRLWRKWKKNIKANSGKQKLVIESMLCFQHVSLCEWVQLILEPYSGVVHHPGRWMLDLNYFLKLSRTKVVRHEKFFLWTFPHFAVNYNKYDAAGLQGNKADWKERKVHFHFSPFGLQWSAWGETGVSVS